MNYVIKTRVQQVSHEQVFITKIKLLQKCIYIYSVKIKIDYSVLFSPSFQGNNCFYIIQSFFS